MNRQMVGLWIRRVVLLLMIGLILTVFVSEFIKLLEINRNDLKYRTKHVVANAFVNTCNGQKRVLVELKETLRDYESEINRHADSGDKNIKRRIQSIAKRHEGMRSSLQKNVEALSTLVSEHSDMLPDGYRISLGVVKVIATELDGIIKRITIPEPHQYVYLYGLHFSMHSEFVRLQTPIDSMISDYGFEKLVNYNQHLRKDEIMSQHFHTILVALIALFFNIVTIYQFWDPKRHPTKHST